MEAKEHRESFCTLLLPLALVADVQRNCSRSKLVLKNQSGGLFQPFSGFSIKCLPSIPLKINWLLLFWNWHGKCN
jgi:hypothetical protein